MQAATAMSRGNGSRLRGWAITCSACCTSRSSPRLVRDSNLLHSVLTMCPVIARCAGALGPSTRRTCAAGVFVHSLIAYGWCALILSVVCLYCALSFLVPRGFILCVCHSQHTGLIFWQITLLSFTFKRCTRSFFLCVCFRDVNTSFFVFCSLTFCFFHRLLFADFRVLFCRLAFLVNVGFFA